MKSKFLGIDIQKSSRYMKLYIIGNSFDLMRYMKSRYSDLKKRLIMNGHFDIIEEFQSVFRSKQDNDYLLWMDFEKAIGEYDIDVTQSRSFQNLYVIECFNKKTKILSTDGFINVQLDDIVNDIYSQWVSRIPLVSDGDMKSAVMIKSALSLVC